MDNLEKNLPEGIPSTVEPGEDHVDGEEYDLCISLSPDLKNANIIADPKLLKIFKNHPDAALRVYGSPYVEVVIYIKDFKNEELPED